MVVVQTLLESMSRCFGSQCANGESPNASKLTDANEAADKDTAGDNSPANAANTASTAATSSHGSASGTSPTSGGVSGNVRSRVLKGLELQNQEFDALFQPTTPNRTSKAATPATPTSASTSKSRRDSEGNNGNINDVTPETEINIADVVAKARRAAHPEHHRTPVQEKLNAVSAISATRTKLRAEKRKADIFRMRPGDEHYNPTRHGKYNVGSINQRAKNSRGGATPGRSGLFSSKFLSETKVFANALCFATPVRDTSVEEAMASKNSGKNSAVEHVDSDDNEDDLNTLNTCEDTITSTLYYDSKFSHVVESRPPMPLFRHFQVPCDEEHQNNELKRIVSSGSHRSFNLWHVIHPEENDATHGSPPHSPRGATKSVSNIHTGAAPPLNKSPAAHHLRKSQTPTTPASANKKKTRSIEETTPVMVVDPQVKHHPKQSTSASNSISKTNLSTPTRPASSQPKQSSQHNMRVTISSSDSEDVQDHHYSQQRDLKKSNSSSSACTPSRQRRSSSIASMKDGNTTSTTPNTIHTTVSGSSSSSSSARRPSSFNKSDGAATKLEARLLHRNQLGVISTSPNDDEIAKSDKSFQHSSVSIVTPTSNQPHYTMGNDTDALPSMLKLKNSSASTAPSTPTCSRSRSVSLERGGGRFHSSGELSSSSHSGRSPNPAGGGGSGVRREGVGTVTHNVIA